MPLSSFSCTQCNPRKKKSTRNLVVCIDDNPHQLGQNVDNTNVVKLFAKIDLESIHPEQFAYYSSGIGAQPGSESSRVLSRMQRIVYDKFHMVIVQNAEEIVRDAYTWLVQMYQEGDRIYLFGFSRGAYQVRVLAGMIHEVGLVKEDRIRKASYDAIRQGKPMAMQRTKDSVKNTSSRQDTRVHFVGVWDTVSSIGFIRGDVLLSVSSSAKHACHFRHALALDERRVKFMPEYFYEVNSQTGVGRSYVTASRNTERAGSSSNLHQSPLRDDGTNRLEGKKWPDIKEVWFAGCHSDVGGKSRPGEFRNAGNVSLLWMRQETSVVGLMLKPTDVVWLPDDLDSGISSPVTPIWRAVEYLPIKHQVSFSGAGEHALRWHRLQPRRIIPGQKVHASILYANTYAPKGALGKGLDIPIMPAVLEDVELDDQIWETGLFDDTAAQELLTSLSSQQGVAPIYLDRLMFMLRFKEGRRCIKEVADWQAKFMTVITGHNYASLVKLVAIVAYHEVSCDLDINKGCALSTIEPDDIFLDAKECTRDILATHRHQDITRMFVLLRSLTKHRVLRERITSSKIPETVARILDTLAEQSLGSFGQVMDSFACLLRCEDFQQILVQELGAMSPNSNVSRLSFILKAGDPRFLPAALRMVSTLARIPEARDVCSVVKPRIKELASQHDQLVGYLAGEILLILDDPTRNALTVDAGQRSLSHLFGLDAKELSGPQRRLIGELKKAIERGNVQERTIATMTLLKLCETAAIRTYLCDNKMLSVFVRQMRRRDSALLAAYAVATCMKYNDLKESIKDNDGLPNNIVRMLRLDYFDDAVHQVEGFQIFGDLMQHAELREKVTSHKIMTILMTKLAKGKPKEIRISLICLDIFRSFDPESSWTHELINNSLENLKNPEWKVQKAGVTILYALTQTEHGVAAISPYISDIVEMLLPAGYLLIRPTRTAAGCPTFPSECESQADSTSSFPSTSHDTRPRPPSWMMGPACALRTLAQNEILRDCIRESLQYRYLKDLFLSGALIDKNDTPVWRIKTPRRANVIDMLYKMTTAIDDGPFEQGLMSLGDAEPLHIQHWNHLVTLLRNRFESVATVLSALLGVPVLAILGMVVYTPIYASSRMYSHLKRVVLRYQDRHAMHDHASNGGH